MRCRIKVIAGQWHVLHRAAFHDSSGGRDLAQHIQVLALHVTDGSRLKNAEVSRVINNNLTSRQEMARGRSYSAPLVK
jgi:hypothetical protein